MSAAPGFRVRVAESVDDGLVGKEFHLDHPCLIGRIDECDVVLASDKMVSRRHARIEPAARGFVLKDQGSANGTWVGETRVTEAPLDHLDRFRIGNTVLEFLRDDDVGDDELDQVRTTAIPVKELLQSIAIALDKELDEEGEAVLVAGNKPFLIDDPATVWLVQSGRLDVFAVPVKDGEPGARSHFVGIEPGQAVFGMNLAEYGMGWGFLAAGKTGTRLRKIPVARLAELAAKGKHRERIALLLDTWINALSKSLARDLPANRSTEADLVEGETVNVGFQQRARSRKGVVWVEIAPGDLLLLSLSEIAFDGTSTLFPVSTEAWVESAASRLPLTSAATLAVLARAELWRGLDDFHRALCDCEFLNKKLAVVDEYNRLKSKAANVARARESALEEIGGVLASPTERRAEAAPSGEGAPVFGACRIICAELGLDIKRPAEAEGDRSLEDNLLLIAMSSRLRTRQVALRGDWWNHDQGPILGKFAESKEAVALIPRSPKAYDAVDPRNGARQPVTPELAATLDPFGFVIYRRVPEGLLNAKQVAKFGLHRLRPDFLSVVAMGVTMGVLGALTPYVTGRLFDTAIPQAERGMLSQFCLALFISAVASTAFKLTQSIAVLRIQGKMDYSVQAALWDRLLDLPTTFFRKFSSGDLADRAQGIDAIRQLLAGAGVGAILGALSSVFYVALMLTYDFTLASLGIGLTLVFIAFTTTANILQLRYQRDEMALKGRLTGLVLQLISGVGKLRVSGAEDHGFRVWAREFADQRRIAFRAGTIQNSVSVFNSIFPILSSMAIFWTLVSVQSSAAQKGATSSISTGDFIGFNAAFSLFLAAMQSLSDASLSLLKAVPIWERIRPILETPPEIDDTKAAPPTIRGEIEISHVSFRYSEDGPYVLKDVCLKIQPGQFVAFVGGSGCGKSTLMRLMLGFERPESGAIYYDGVDLSTIDVRLLRQQLGVVLQESRVLPADLYRNIVGTSSRTVDEAWEAAEAAGIAEDIREMPMGMHTYVAEGGGGLSGGQRQRLMIARAIVNKPKVLFLDEATSALDNRTQAIVTASMDKMKSSRIVIAHRLSTIQNADKICYLEKGSIVEAGSYDELMKKNGYFAELARRQQV